jgi:hypothetical protein
MNQKQITVFSVIMNKSKLQCIDTTNGSVKGSFSYAGNICNGPIVTGDRCVVVFETPNGKKGKIFKLPTFSTITSFSI